MKTSCSFILALIILLASCKGSTSTAPSPAWVVSTFAGGTAGYQDGDAATARFNNPAGVAVDSSGNVYVADRRNNRIRKITKEDDGTWTVSTLAGGAQGLVDGAAADARFYWPYDVDVDSLGNVYVAEYGNHRIRKITKKVDNAGDETWKVSTLAGGATPQFSAPQGVAVDSSDNVYVADFGNNLIRKIEITPGEGQEEDTVEVSTFAGDGTGAHQDGAALTEAQLSAPTGVDVDKSGNVYVADQNSHRIRKITETEEVDDDDNKIWKVSTLAGGSLSGYQDGAGATARFNRLADVAVDKSGNVYVTDGGNQRIRKIVITPGEGQEEDTVEVSTLAGSTQGYQDGTAARFNSPTGVAVDSSGNVYVADQINNRIRKIEYRVP